jgi:hypothetical protein
VSQPRACARAVLCVVETRKALVSIRTGKRCHVTVSPSWAQRSRHVQFSCLFPSCAAASASCAAHGAAARAARATALRRARTHAQRTRCRDAHTNARHGPSLAGGGCVPAVLRVAGGGCALPAVRVRLPDMRLVLAPTCARAAGARRAAVVVAFLLTASPNLAVLPRLAARRAVMEVAAVDSVAARCPACRATYDERAIDFKPPPPECVFAWPPFLPGHSSHTAALVPVVARAC